MTHRLASLLIVLAGLAGCESSTTNTISTTIANPFAPSPAATTTCATGTCGGTPTCPTGTCGQTPGGGSLTPQQRLPEISLFTSDSYRIGRWDGVGAVLRWDVSDFNANVRIDPYPGNVGAVGFVVVFPGVTTTYTLTARNNLGTVQRQLTILVIE